MTAKSASVRPAGRQRAPRRQGHRAQLTVPTEAWEQAQRLAVEQGTTPNDVLAQLMLRGLELDERERSIAQVAASRVDAYRSQRRVDDGLVLPSAEEAEEQAHAMRRDLAGDA